MKISELKKIIKEELNNTIQEIGISPDFDPSGEDRRGMFVELEEAVIDHLGQGTVELMHAEDKVAIFKILDPNMTIEKVSSLEDRLYPSFNIGYVGIGNIDGEEIIKIQFKF